MRSLLIDDLTSRSACGVPTSERTRSRRRTTTADDQRYAFVVAPVLLIITLVIVLAIFGVGLLLQERRANEVAIVYGI